VESINVLVVDDEQVFCMILRKRLEALGFSTKTTNSAHDALNILKDVLPEMIITDLMMPDMDGIELTKELRKKRSLKETYILMLSARSDQEAKDASYKAGANEYVSKPINDDELSDKVGMGIKWSREKKERKLRKDRR